jgi:hypothetical protein
MWKSMPLTCLAFLLASAACGDEQRPLLKNYSGKEPVPDALYQTYAKLVDAMAAGDEDDIRRFCLPRSVTFTREARPAQTREYGQDVNLPFPKSGFSNEILTAEPRDDGCYLIRTATSVLFFVQTKGGDWKLYRYYDKPTE